jgi:hypothetical protein
MTASLNLLEQRYGDIERLYCERQWDTVIRLSEELLLDLTGEPANPLRQRLQLLLGHTYLYGYQDSTTAAGFYSRVRADTEDPMLRDIANQGLELCTHQAAPPAKPLKSADPAMPWLDQLGGVEPMAVQVQAPVPNLLVEVIQADEPCDEDLMVSMSKESLAGVEKRFATPVTEPSPEEIIELSKGLLRVVIR